MVFYPIVGQHAREGSDFLHGVLRLGGNFFALESENHDAVEGVKNGLNLVDVFGASVAQLDDERQNLVVFGAIERE